MTLIPNPNPKLGFTLAIFLTLVRVNPLGKNPKP